MGTQDWKFKVLVGIPLPSDWQKAVEHIVFDAVGDLKSRDVLGQALRRRDKSMAEGTLGTAVSEAVGAVHAPIMEGYVYLASPYSHHDPTVREARFQAVCRLAAGLMNMGMVVYSPIAHTHPIAVSHALPTTWAFWQRMDSVFVLKADRLLVACLDGWKESTGVQAEIKLATEAGIPVEYLEVV